MDSPRRPTVTPPLQLAALGQTPVHDDPTVRLAGVFPQPLSHRGELWQPPSPAPNWRQSVLVHPTVYLSPQPRIGDQTGDQREIPNEVAVTRGMPASAWALRRNYRPTPAIQAGEAEV